MIKLTLAEQQLRQHLVECAQRGDREKFRTACITYGDAAAAVNVDHVLWKPPRYHGIGTALGHISVYEAQHHRPLLSLDPPR